MTDQKIIERIIVNGLDRMKTCPEPIKEKKEMIIGQIARRINSSSKTVRNALASNKQVLGKDKSTLLNIYAKERGIIK